MKTLRRFAVALWMLVVVPGASLLSAQTATFRSVVERVRLDALITDGGRLIPGLGAEQLEVFDNGVRQTVDHVSLDQIPVNVVFVFDMSESVSGTTITALRSAVDAVASGLRPGDQSALLTFNHRVALQSPLSTDLGGARKTAAALVPGGGTSLVDALYASLWVAASDPGRTAIIVFSDGVDTASWLSSDAVIDAAKRADAVIYAISGRGGRRDRILSELTEATGGRTFEGTSPDRLTTAFTSILEEFRQRYLVSYTPAGANASGWHKVELRVRGRRATVKMRPGYVAGPR